MRGYVFHRAQFNFRKEHFRFGSVYNIPGLSVLAGHGYDLRTYMCASCGTILVVDHELLHWDKKGLVDLLQGVQCPSCARALTLLPHPKYVWHDGNAVVPDSRIPCSDPSATEFLEAFTISQQ